MGKWESLEEHNLSGDNAGGSFVESLEKFFKKKKGGGSAQQ